MIEKIAKEVADKEFDRFVELMALSVDEKDMDQEDLKSFLLEKSRIIKAIQSGAMIINENGEPVYQPQRTKNAEKITFYESTGAALTATDKTYRNHAVSKLFAAMGDITKLPQNTFSKMKMSDLRVCMAVANLFLAQ